MIYKLLNYLFGWDYIAWSNCADSGIARVHYGYDGTAWYWRYKTTKVIDKIHNPKHVTWLTCYPNKYIIGAK